MKYRTTSPNPIASGCRLPIRSRPTLSINPADWFHLQRLDADNPDTHIIGHDAPQDGMMTVYVAWLPG